MIFAVLALQFPNSSFRTPASPYISFVRDTNVNLAFAGTLVGLLLFVIWANLMIAGTSNGVNLTDGLDGLATGASVMVFAAYVLIGIWQFNQNCQTNPGVKCYEVRDAHDLAVVAACVMGACFGFLWWNASPAKIFMGDTGSLALGGALAGLAITTRTELLVVILGGLFVIITLSVIIQVGSFKLTGKRVFRMAPLQHHFELVGLERGHHRHPVLDHRRACSWRWASGSSTPSGWSGQDEQLAHRPARQRPYEPRPPGLTHRDADWAGLRVLVAGLGVSGFAAADALADAGRGRHRRSTRRRDRRRIRERAHILDILGVDVRHRRRARWSCRARGHRAGRHLAGLAARPPAARRGRRGAASRSGARSSWPGGCARAIGAAPWLTVTGTNGKTTTVNMLASILRAAGLRATSAGNVGHARCSRRCCTPSRTTCWPSSCPASSCTGSARWRRSRRACLNVAPDHLDWHGSLEEYRLRQGPGLPEHRDRLRLQRRRTRVTEQLVMDADVVEGCRAIGFTLGVPALSMVGPRRRRAGRPRVRRAAAHLGGRARRRCADLQGDAPSRRARTTSPTRWPPRRWPGRTACRRSPSATACAAFRARPAPHRRRRDRRRGPVRRRLQGHQPARGGRLAAGVRARRLGRRRPAQGRRASTTWSAPRADRLRGVVLHRRRPAADRRGAGATRARRPRRRRARHGDWCHGSSSSTRGRRPGGPGDVVLLAPAAASMDMFADYAARGDAFAAAVQRHASRPGGPAAS